MGDSLDPRIRAALSGALPDAAGHDLVVELEGIEIEAMRDLWQAPDPDTATAIGLECRDLGGALCTVVRTLPATRMLNRIVGLGLAAPASEDDLAAAAGFMESRDVCFTVSLAPTARPMTLTGRLAARGLVAGYAWMRFLHDGRGGAASTRLRVEEVAGDRGADFAAPIVSGFEMPGSLAPWFAALPGRPGWTCLVACDGDRAVAAAAMYARPPAAWLGFAATLPEARGQGAQGALLVERVRRAAALGCPLVTLETGERVPDRPDASYRNILRQGFVELYLRPNFYSPDPPAG